MKTGKLRQKGQTWGESSQNSPNKMARCWTKREKQVKTGKNRQKQAKTDKLVKHWTKCSGRKGLIQAKIN